MTRSPASAYMLAMAVALICSASGFQPSSSFGKRATQARGMDSRTALAYEPKWKKKETLADQAQDLEPEDKGLIGTIPVVFKQGNETITTTAIPGQPLSFVAAQAGQYIRYGCKKGECGTCEAMCNGKWIRPCVEPIPDLAEGEQFVVQVKEIKAKSKSSGKFFSVKSFFMGFYNNLIGMVGFVKRRRAAKKNWDERQEYEDLVAIKTAEKRAARLAREAAAAASKE